MAVDKLAWLALALFCTPVLISPTLGESTEQTETATVVLLHGLLRSERHMRKLERRLGDAGFHVVNIGYPSARHGIDTLAALLDQPMRQCCVDQEHTVHFVTHSLGGIVLRRYLEQPPLLNVGRVVMLSPPNRGSEVVDRTWVRGLAFFAGPARKELGTDVASIPNTLGPFEYELGVITGSRSLNPLFSALIPGPDDGAVAVERAKVAGMDDFLVLPYSHSRMVKKPQVAAQVIHFLEHGSFRRHPVAAGNLSTPQ